MSVVGPSPVARPGGYAELAAELRRLGLMRRDARVLRRSWSAACCSRPALAAVTMVLLRDSWWALLVAPVLGVLSTQMGFFGHDATHRQISHRERPSRVLGMLAGNLLQRAQLRLVAGQAQRPPRAPERPRVGPGRLRRRGGLRRRPGGRASRRGRLDDPAPGLALRPDADARGAEPARVRRARGAPARAAAPARGGGAAGGALRGVRRAARAHPDLAAGDRLRGGPPGGVRGLPRDVVRAGAQGDARPRRRAGGRPAAAAGADLTQRPRRAAGDGGARRAQLPDRAPPLPEHAAAPPAAGAARGAPVLPRAGRRLRGGVARPRRT